MPAAFSSHADTTDYEPFVGGEVVEGKPDEQVHWLRTEGSGEGVLKAGLFTAQPGVVVGPLPVDETVYVLEGHARVEIEGEVVELTPGVLASFPRDVMTRWTFLTPFKEFFVLCG